MVISVDVCIIKAKLIAKEVYVFIADGSADNLTVVAIAIEIKMLIITAENSIIAQKITKLFMLLMAVKNPVSRATLFCKSTAWLLLMMPVSISVSMLICFKGRILLTISNVCFLICRNVLNVATKIAVRNKPEIIIGNVPLFLSIILLMIPMLPRIIINLL